MARASLFVFLNLLQEFVAIKLYHFSQLKILEIHIRNPDRKPRFRFHYFESPHAAIVSRLGR